MEKAMRTAPSSHISLDTREIIYYIIFLERMNQLVLIENFSCQFIIVPTALVLRETKIIIMTIDAC